MFRLKPSGLPKDPVFPADLDKLGYSINDKDQIRAKWDPEQEFHFFISKNERYKEVNREAFNSKPHPPPPSLANSQLITPPPPACIRRIVLARLTSAPISLQVTPLPYQTPPTSPHIPILTSANIATASSRLILYVGETMQDLGILAYRLIGQECNDAGSAVPLSALALAAHDAPALAIANLGQLLWYRGGGRAVSSTTWRALPRASEVHGPMQIEDEGNRVERNASAGEHLACVFEDVVGKMARPGVKVQVVAVGDGALELVEFLQAEWERWGQCVDSIVVGAHYVWTTPFEDQRFMQFWGKRARAYIRSEQPLDTPLPGRKSFGCNCYSAGENEHLECIMPRAFPAVLRYLQLCADRPDYETPPQDFDEDADDGTVRPDFATMLEQMARERE